MGDSKATSENFRGRLASLKAAAADCFDVRRPSAFALRPQIEIEQPYLVGSTASTPADPRESGACHSHSGVAADPSQYCSTILYYTTTIYYYTTTILLRSRTSPFTGSMCTPPVHTSFHTSLSHLPSTPQTEAQPFQPGVCDATLLAIHASHYTGASHTSNSHSRIAPHLSQRHIHTSRARLRLTPERKSGDGGTPHRSNLIIHKSRSHLPFTPQPSH